LEYNIRSEQEINFAQEMNDLPMLLFFFRENSKKSVEAAHYLKEAASKLEHIVVVLLIDCDLRRPRVSYQLGIKTENDIEDVLMGKVPLEQAIVYGEKQNLYALVANKDYSNASEMLESDRMKLLMDKVHKCFDFVVFDTCPILSTADPAIIGPLVGGVLLIIQTRKTQRESIYHAADLLREADATAEITAKDPLTSG